MVNPRSLFVCALAGVSVSGLAGAEEPAGIIVHVNKPGAKIGPLFYGLMTEEINHSYDGGLYAELIQNRIFQDDSARPTHWSVVTSGDGAGTIAIDETQPVNTTALTRSLRLDVADAGGRVGVANDGYWGIPVRPNTTYRASFYARAGEGFTGGLTVDIESNNGKTTFARATVPAVGNDWKKYEVELHTADVPAGEDNRFVISAGGKGSVWFSLVSLFPPTYHNRPNGNRVDLMEKMAALHPTFLRFPGGNFLEGDTVADRFAWKQTLGPLENRPGHGGCWGYRASDGLGLLEFLNWCEDLHMEPLLAVYAGYSLKGQHVEPGPDLEPFVQEALDEIEYCTGNTATTWGARRAKDGHPEPFALHYVEIGNEDWFDKSGSYDGRFTQIFDGIKAKYPNLQCIATASVRTRKPDLVDDHAYPSPRGLERMVHRYDRRNPSLPKVFFGEWAAQEGRPTPTMRAALADAAWLTGLQHDADTVLMNCYAPLLVNVNQGAWRWPTNLIGYDALNSFGSPSFYAQAMMTGNLGDVDLPVEVAAAEVAPVTPHGAVGVGTWATEAQFKDLKVTHDGAVVWQPNPSSTMHEWKPVGGKWATADGVIGQTTDARPAMLTAGDASWQDYTFSLKARKTGGKEGFTVLFHVAGKEQYAWFNVGGWDNTKAAVEQSGDGDRVTLGDGTPFSVETGRWYDVRVEVRGANAKCYVDDKLLARVTEQPFGAGETLFAAANRVDATGELVLKVINSAQVPQRVKIKLDGAEHVSAGATVDVLTGDPVVQNTLDEPTKIAPRQEKLTDAGTAFVHEFPAYSVSVIHFNGR